MEALKIYKMKMYYKSACLVDQVLINIMQYFLNQATHFLLDG